MGYILDYSTVWTSVQFGLQYSLDFNIQWTDYYWNTLNITEDWNYYRTKMTDEIIMKMMEKLDTVVNSIKTLSENQKNMIEAFEKGRIMDRLDYLEEQTDENTDKIAELEVKVNAVINGERSKNDWAVIVEEENNRRKNNVKMLEKMKEKEKKKEKLTYKEKMMKELKESAKVIVKEVREEEIDEEKGREEIIKNSKKILGFKPIIRDNVEYFIRG